MIVSRGDTDPDDCLFRRGNETPVTGTTSANTSSAGATDGGPAGEHWTYDLRHSHASLLIDLGANPLAMAQRMGHNDAAFTLRVYGHLFESAQAKLSEQLDALRQETANSPAKGTIVNLDTRRDLTQTRHAYDSRQRPPTVTDG
jgi:hypothetical protein